MAEVKEEVKSKEDVEAEISSAMRARLSDFKDQADSLTLEGVRRVLEKDLGMKTFALDVHKKFIKQCMEKYFYGPESKENAEEAAQLETGEEKRRRECLEPHDEPRAPSSEIDEKKEGISSKGRKKTPERESENTQGVESESDISEETIGKAIKKRAMYFRENSEYVTTSFGRFLDNHVTEFLFKKHRNKAMYLTMNVTMSGVRRLLEEDLKLEKNTLDAYKSFIRKQLDEILYAEVVEPTNGIRKSTTKKVISSTKTSKVNKASVKPSRESESSDDHSYPSETHSDNEEVNEEQTKPKKRSTKELKTKTSKVQKKQKISTKESKSSSSGRKKPVEVVTQSGSDSEDGVDASEDDRSNSSVVESPKKKKENPPAVYGKKVEHLKSVIKSCGMGIPPAIYKRVKQAPEGKREAFLIKELEGILQREGLSTNPSEKEIKAVKKKKERAKELEGIDMSNIVSSSRRRGSSSFIPPKPQIPAESESEEDQEDEDNSDDENSDSGVSSEGSEEDDEEGD